MFWAGNVVSFPVQISKFLERVKYTPLTITPEMSVTFDRSIRTHLNPVLTYAYQDVPSFPSITFEASYPFKTQGEYATHKPLHKSLQEHFWSRYMPCAAVDMHCDKALELGREIYPIGQRNGVVKGAGQYDDCGQIHCVKELEPDATVT